MTIGREQAWGAALAAFGECQSWVFRNDVVNDPHWQAAWQFLKSLHAAFADADFQEGRFTVKLKRPLDDVAVGVILELDKALKKHNAPVSVVVEDGEGAKDAERS